MLRDADFQLFFSYWKELANAAGDIPARSAVQLKDFHQSAPNFYILEWHGLFDVRIRFFGTVIDDFLPTLTVGDNFLNIYEDEHRPFYAAAFRDVVSQPCGVDMLRSITLANGQEMDVRGTGLPLRDCEGKLRYIAGLVDTPSRDQPLGFSEGLKRATSSIKAMDYWDLGFGVPKEKPAFPPVGRYAGSLNDD